MKTKIFLNICSFVFFQFVLWYRILLESMFRYIFFRIQKGDIQTDKISPFRAWWRNQQLVLSFTWNYDEFNIMSAKFLYTHTYTQHKTMRMTIVSRFNVSAICLFLSIFHDYVRVLLLVKKIFWKQKKENNSCS